MFGVSEGAGLFRIGGGLRMEFLGPREDGAGVARLLAKELAEALGP